MIASVIAASPRVGLEVGDERDVDLERVDREVLQVRERRVAGAEVVDRDREAFVAQLVQHLADRVEVVQQARLGHLELDPRRLAAGAAHDVAGCAARGPRDRTGAPTG